ncbi:hypothetical protein BC332_06107 [Capsicum chinense]|nr:hypothetical protein BC332_06107 [Capsicum chinense]
MNKLELVFVPAPGVSHLISVCKFAEKLVNRDERLCATFLIIRPPPPVDASVDAYIKQKSSDSQGSRIRYITLAKIKPPPSDEIGKSIDRKDVCVTMTMKFMGCGIDRDKAVVLL